LTTTTLHPAPLRDAARTALAKLAAGVALVGSILDTFASAQRCAAEIERLRRLSDAELARRGLARGEIVTYAFRKHMQD
jgi:hypothetical protein